MTDRKFESMLATVVHGADDGVSRVETFEEAGILTRNRGLVVTFDDGSEFQLTIVRSRRGKGPCSEADNDEA